LYGRLGELTEAALIRKNDDGRYELTAQGASLSNALAPLDAWSKQWSTSLETETAGRAEGSGGD
jgi:DNA-binding HxlR family transcriptional regulator